MALSISSGHTAEYLTGPVAEGRESYYLDATTHGEPPGRWWGSGAEELGLSGEVDNGVMTALYSEFLDPRDPRSAAEDPDVRESADRLGRPRAYTSAEQTIAATLRAEPDATPERVREITAAARRNERQPVMFIDATFSPVKSFTVLHTALHRAEVDAEREGDEPGRQMWAGMRAEAEAALWAGNRAMLSTLSARAGYARAGRHGAGAGRWVDAHDWTVASFHQSDSRAHDPQQHIHNAILNRAQAADGQWRALDSRAIHAWKQAAGAYGERVMEEELSRRLGLRFALRADGAGREIVGISQQAMDLFSERSRNMSGPLRRWSSAFEEQHGRAPNALEVTRARQRLALHTRRAKSHEGESRADMLARWDRELRAEVAGGLHQVADDIRRTAATSTGPGRAETFSPSGVVAEAVAACQETRPAFTRSELERQIIMRLPDLGGMDAGDVRDLVDGLADEAVEGLVPVSGAEPTEAVPDELRLADGRSVYANPSGARYATSDHVVAEQALRRAAVTRGRPAARPAHVDRWLRDNGQTLGADQAAAVRGLLTSGAAVSMLVGPAGTGKSYTLGTFAEAWSDLYPDRGQVIGLATAQVAADVLTDDGVPAMNTARWLAVQARRADQRPRTGDADWYLTKHSVVVLDESSMADLDQVTAVRRHVEAAGARLILAGDPEQLSAVGAGGAMDVVGGTEGADAHHLTDVRRFREEWERSASLRLRDGDPSVLAEYDRHGRIRDAGTIDGALAAAARAYTGDVLAGRTAVVVTPTNELAARASRMVREHLVEAGRVRRDGIELARDGNTVGIGDTIQARRNDRDHGVTNRARYTVTGFLPDSGLAVADEDGTAYHLPRAYVQQHVTLGYAGTVHSVEGMTVDAGHGVATPASDLAALYVEMTRGRDRNTVWAATQPESPAEATGETHARQRRDALAMLSDTLEGDRGQERAVLHQVAEDTRQASSARTALARIEDAVRHIGRRRMDRHLDELTDQAALTPEQREALAGDQGSEQLSRTLRAVEQAGHDPRQALSDAIEERSLDDARSLAQVLQHRITTSYADTLAPSAEDIRPAGGGRGWDEYLAELDDIAATRQRDLGTGAGQEPPRWARQHLGPVPAEPVARLEWEQRAGQVAVYREATGWDDEAEPIGPAPGLGSSERRGWWHRAWSALGRPDTTPEEHQLSDGALRNRVRAWQREQEWAPADVYDQQRTTEAELADAETTWSMSMGNRDLPFDWEATEDRIDMLRSTARDLDTAAQVRAEWLVETAATREVAERAEAALAARGRPIDAEDDRVSAEEWLEEHRRAMAAEDEHRPITEEDISDAWSVQREPLADEPAAALTTSEPTEAGPAEAEQDQAHEQAEPAEEPDLPAGVPSRAETAAAVASASLAADEMARRRAAEADHERDEAAAAEVEAESGRIAHARAEQEHSADRSMSMGL